MIIRKAQPTDANAIAKVHVDSWRTTYAGIISADFLANLSYEQREASWRETLSVRELNLCQKIHSLKCLVIPSRQDERVADRPQLRLG